MAYDIFHMICELVMFVGVILILYWLFTFQDRK